MQCVTSTPLCWMWDAALAHWVGILGIRKQAGQHCTMCSCGAISSVCDHSSMRCRSRMRSI
jgi:hypothetical protein